MKFNALIGLNWLFDNDWLIKGIKGFRTPLSSPTYLWLLHWKYIYFHSFLDFWLLFLLSAPLIYLTPILRRVKLNSENTLFDPKFSLGICYFYRNHRLIVWIDKNDHQKSLKILCVKIKYKHTVGWFWNLKVEQFCYISEIAFQNCSAGYFPLRKRKRKFSLNYKESTCRGILSLLKKGFNPLTANVPII